MNERDAIATVEQDLVDRIKALFTRDGQLVLRKVAATDSHLDQEGLTREVNSAPSVLVLFQGGDPVPAMEGTLIGRFLVYAIARHGGGGVAGRHGDGGTIGGYEMAGILFAGLHNQDFGHGAAGVAAVENIYSGKLAGSGVVVFGLDLRQTIPFGAIENPDLVDLAGIAIDWDIPPHEGLAGPLPNAGADLSDRLESEDA